jgi:hypothetical protein
MTNNQNKKIIVLGMPKSGKTSLILAFERSILQIDPHHFEKFGERVRTTAQDFNAIKSTTAPGIHKYSLQLKQNSAKSEFAINEFPHTDQSNPFDGFMDEFLAVHKECSDILLTIPHPESKDTTSKQEDVQRYYQDLLTYLDELSRELSSPPVLRLVFTKAEQDNGVGPAEIEPVIEARLPLLAEFLNTSFRSVQKRQVFTVGWDIKDNVNYGNQTIKEESLWRPKQVFELFKDLLSLEGNK